MIQIDPGLITEGCHRGGQVKYAVQTFLGELFSGQVTDLLKDCGLHNMLFILIDVKIM